MASEPYLRDIERALSKLVVTLQTTNKWLKDIAKVLEEKEENTSNGERAD